MEDDGRRPWDGMDIILHPAQAAGLEAGYQTGTAFGDPVFMRAYMKAQEEYLWYEELLPSLEEARLPDVRVTSILATLALEGFDGP